MAVPQQSILALAAILTSSSSGEGGGKLALGLPWGCSWRPPGAATWVICLLACCLGGARFQISSFFLVWRCCRGSIRGQPPDGLHEQFYTERDGCHVGDFHLWITSLHYASSATACEKVGGFIYPLRLTTLSRAKDSEFEPWQPRLAVPMLLGGWWHAGCPCTSML